MMDAYRALFAEAIFVSGERTEWGMRWTFRDTDYVQLPQTAFGSVEALRDRTIATGLFLNDQRQPRAKA